MAGESSARRRDAFGNGFFVTDLGVVCNLSEARASEGLEAPEVDNY